MFDFVPVIASQSRVLKAIHRFKDKLLLSLCSLPNPLDFIPNSALLFRPVVHCCLRGRFANHFACGAGHGVSRKIPSSRNEIRALCVPHNQVFLWSQARGCWIQYWSCWMLGNLGGSVGMMIFWRDFPWVPPGFEEPHQE